MHKTFDFCRKSPVTVQEWVASLPLPHLLQRQELGAADVATTPEGNTQDDLQTGSGFGEEKVT